MTRPLRMLLFSTPALLVIVVLVATLALMDSAERRVDVLTNVEDAVQVTPSGLVRFVVEFQNDGEVRISGAGSLPTGRFERSLDRFVAAASEKAVVRSEYEIAGRSAIDGSDGPLLRKVYLVLPENLATTPMVYVEEYPLEFGGIWGGYRITDSSRIAVSVNWNNRSDVIFAMLMLAFLGPFVAVIGTWWLKQRYPITLSMLAKRVS